jgi:single-stranded-DNA-specific exonuclease
VEHERIFAVEPAPPTVAATLRKELGISQILADTLVRRGYRDPDEARAFLAGDAPEHDPLLLGDMAAALASIGAALDRGAAIAVHGDYDCDGVCATAVLVEGLQRLGGRITAFVPHRMKEGYGLSTGAVERLHGEGVELLITVDCGITGAEAVERAHALGLDVVVTDHHRPGSTLPDCPIVAPTQGGTYPFEGLSGTGVAYKLLTALVDERAGDPAILEEALDLVAIATVADMMPLVDENRGLVRAGLRRLRREPRTGIAALLQVAKVDPRTVDGETIGFRIAPRINAAGRLDDARLALDLLLADDPARARELAEQLDALNRRRRGIEDRILREALAAFEALPAEQRERRGVVLAGDDWHPGVVGIVAARVVERLGRPVVLVGLEGAVGRGSGRSVPGFDLHAALAACDAHLERWGGHRAAAGVTVRTEAVDAFAEAFSLHADAVLVGADVRPVERIDAVASLTEVTLDVADELAALAPFGIGNPAPTIWIPAAEARQVRRIGGEGKHLDLRVHTAVGSCRAVAWGMGGRLDEITAAERIDVAARVTRSSWQGTDRVELVATALQPVPAPRSLATGCHEVCDRGCRDRRGLLDVVGDGARVGSPLPESGGGVELLDHRARGAMAELARSAATGAGTLVVVVDVGRRRSLFSRVLPPERFGLAGPVLFSGRCRPEVLVERLATLDGRPTLAMTDFATLDRLPALAHPFGEVIVLDPPPDGWRPPVDGPRWIRVDGAAEARFAEAVRAATGEEALGRRLLGVLGVEPTPIEVIERRLAEAEPGPAVDAEYLAAALSRLLAQGQVVRTDGGIALVGAESAMRSAAGRLR